MTTTAQSPSSSSIPLYPPPPIPEDDSDPYARHTFQAASPAQILRSYQRDTSQVQRLTDLASEIIRSFAGTRWLAHKQFLVNIAIRAAYLLLTFGRGSQTMGEEYTDITPYSSRSKRLPSRVKRYLTIFFLLSPALGASPPFQSLLRPPERNPVSALDKIRFRLARFLDSPLGQSLPELHMLAFLYSGRFFEYARRLTGLTYVSTQPAKPPERRQATYEPLAMLLALPILYRLSPRRPTVETSNSVASNDSLQEAKSESLPLSPPLEPRATAEETLLASRNSGYDAQNTYLDDEAQTLPERQCTLCLEPRGTGEGSGGTVAVTECGHVFCWGCLGGLEKLECPLCRQSIRLERLIAAYNL